MSRHPLLRLVMVFLFAVALGMLLGARIGSWRKASVRAQAPERHWIFLPSTWRGVALADLPPPTPAAAQVSATPIAATSTPSPVPATATQAPATPTEAPTEPPTEPATATPTEEPGKPGRLTGRLTEAGEPMAYWGLDGPWVELRRRRGQGPWERLAVDETDAAGRFEFEVTSPAEGEVLQVWWNNPSGVGGPSWLNRWWSRDVTAVGPDETVDLGTFEVANLSYDDSGICDDCAQTAPITFKWRARAHAGDRYRWALHETCYDMDDRANAWHSADLRRGTQYVTAPPPGFQYDTKYCWFILIDDGENGQGWPWFDWKVFWCSSAATCRGLEGAWEALDLRWDRRVGAPRDSGLVK